MYKIRLTTVLKCCGKLEVGITKLHRQHRQENLRQRVKLGQTKERELKKNE